LIRAILFEPDTKSAHVGGEELISQWKESGNGILWADIEGGDAEHDESVLAGFGIHPLAIQDALRQRHPPKIERFDSYWFILMRGLDADSEGIDFGAIQLSIFVGDRFLLSRHSQRSISANWLFDQLERDPAWMSEGSGSLAIRLSNRLARRYVELLLELEPRLDEIEEEMFEHPDDELLSELTQCRSQLRKLNRIANYHQQIASTLRGTSDSLFDTSLSHRIVDLYEQIERTQSLSNLFYQIATDLTDGYLGISSHRLNRVMQILTIITVIFVPLTFLAGIYGMNFQNMPELSTRTGYFVVIGIMFVIAAMQVIYFRRKRWM
jgi:magnesium transporter